MGTSKGLPRFGQALSGHLPPRVYHRLTSRQRRLKWLVACCSIVPSQPENPPYIGPVEITIPLNELGFRPLQGLLDFVHRQGVDLMGPLPAGKLDGFLIRPLNREPVAIDQLEPTEEQHGFCLLLLREAVTSC